MKINYPHEKLLQSQYIADEVDFTVLQLTGVFHLRQVFSQDVVNKYYNIYKSSLGTTLKKTEQHVTEVRVQDDQHPICDVYKEPEFLKIAEKFFDGQVGSDFIRILKKDSLDIRPVFLHQDICYHIGSFDKYSFFIALTDCNVRNGGLTFFLGTQNFGFLGDIGEIRESLLPPDYPKYTPEMKAGDLIIMHSAVWHKSPANMEKTERVYLEVNIQSLNDASTRTIVSGHRESEWDFQVTPADIFTLMPRLARR